MALIALNMHVEGVRGACEGLFTAVERQWVLAPTLDLVSRGIVRSSIMEDHTTRTFFKCIA